MARINQSIVLDEHASSEVEVTGPDSVGDLQLKSESGRIIWLSVADIDALYAWVHRNESSVEYRQPYE
jgi:hypothetical protein